MILPFSSFFSYIILFYACSYNIIKSKTYNKQITIKPGGKFVEEFKGPFDERYLYKVRIKGELDIPCTNRVEEIYPVYLRKLDDSLVFDGKEYFLTLNESNYEYERSCYYMCRADFISGTEYNFS